MSPLVRIVGGREEEPGLFIPLPQRKHDTQALEAALPELREELAQRWPVKEVRIRYRLPNPPPVTCDLMLGTVAGLFVTSAAITAGHAFGKDIGKQMARVVNGWLKRLERRKNKPRRPRKS